MQDSLGFIETRGFVPLLNATDAMLKAAGVKLIKYERVGGGFAAVCIAGELAAVKAAIEAGVNSITGTSAVVSAVLAKPGKAVWSLLQSAYPHNPSPGTNAVGLIETQGFVPSVTAIDAMDKAADVVFLGYENVGDGLVTVMVSGELAAVKHATEAGAAAATGVGKVISARVISRPQGELEGVLLLTSGASYLSIPQGSGATAIHSRSKRKGK